MRNGNLYRRVLLVAPELQSAIVQAANNTANSQPVGYDANGNPITAFVPTAFGGLPVSWQAVNDLSARPAATGPNTQRAISPRRSCSTRWAT